MTIRTYIFKRFLLFGVVIFGSLGVLYGATSMENPILNIIYTMTMIAGAVATGIYINNTFKTVK